MTTEIIMPKLGLTMTEGTVDKWEKKVGDHVEIGDVLCSISSEKLTHDVEATESGILVQILAEEGEEVPCKAPIALIGDSMDDNNEEPQVKKNIEKPKEEEKTELVKDKIEKKSDTTNQGSERIFITPLARKVAKDKGYDISLINGSGGNGRITIRDVNMYVPQQIPEQNNTAKPQQAQGLAGMRRTIAERMMNSLRTSAQVSIHQKADISSLIDFKKELKEKSNLPLDSGQTSITTLLSRAVVLALKDIPKMNAWYDGSDHTVVPDINLGMAVALPEGLVVPVVQNADKMTLTELAKSLNDRIEKAQSGTLESQNYSGSTFTITNIGKSGVEYFTPILNTPEVGILGVGTMMNELAFGDDGESIIQLKKLPLSLTFDHQVIDGAPAAEFLARIIFYLEHPYSLIL